MMLAVTQPNTGPIPQRFGPDHPAPYPPPIPPGQHYPPPPGYPPPACPPNYQAVNVVVPPPRSCPHVMHAVLTFLTCGLWLPVWIIDAIAKSG